MPGTQKKTYAQSFHTVIQYISLCVKKAEQKQAISTTKLFISILLTIYFNSSHSHITNPVLILSEFLLELFFFLDLL